MNTYTRAQPVTDNLIVETLPPSIAKPAVMKWRSGKCGRIIRDYLETTYRTDTARDAEQDKDDKQ